MADNKPTENNPRLLGGINMKASEYSLSKAQFLNLRNLDFDVPNALNKRPGSTQAIAVNTSGPITAMHEFINLSGASTVVVASDTALFYMNNATLQPLATGWSNGQPPDMLTFVNKEWIANGSRFYGWSGVGVSALPAGLPCTYGVTQAFAPNSGASVWTIGGATMGPVFGGAAGSYILRGVYLAYSYLRNDGYWGPLDFHASARNIVYISKPVNNGAEFFNEFPLVSGFTIPSTRGISAIALWMGVDSIDINTTTRAFIPNVGDRQVGNLGWYDSGGVPVAQYLSLTLKPDADLSRFYLYTLIPSASLALAVDGSGQTYWAFSLGFNFNSFTGVAGNGKAFTGLPFCWFDTNTPKYIEVNQNSMFMSGFSGNPSNVWFSELGQPENIQPDSVFEVRTNDGDRVYAIKNYNNQVIVLKQNSFHKVIGDSPENFELIELSGEYGCISNQSVVEYEEKLMWLDQKGIVEFNGTSWNIKSTPVEDIFRRMNLDAAKEKATGIHHLYRNQIWWGIPIDGSTKNNLTVVYDYLVDAWTFFDGFNPSSFAFIKGNLTKSTVFRGDYSGMIYYHGESFLGDNGQAITCIATPHWDKNKENETHIWRRAFLDVATVTGLTGQITAKVFRNYDLSTVQATFSMLQDAFQSRAEMGVVGKAVTAEFAHVSASLPLLINNYSWAKRFLRNV